MSRTGPKWQDLSTLTSRPAKFTLATNPAGAALGMRDFADLATHPQELGSRISPSPSRLVMKGLCSFGLASSDSRKPSARFKPNGHDACK
jgi:hypothetical protein